MENTRGAKTSHDMVDLEEGEYKHNWRLLAFSTWISSVIGFPTSEIVTGSGLSSCQSWQSYLRDEMRKEEYRTLSNTVATERRCDCDPPSIAMRSDSSFATSGRKGSRLAGERRTVHRARMSSCRVRSKERYY